MTNNENEKNYTEMVATDNAIEMGRPVQMVSPKGGMVWVMAERVMARLDAGYKLI